MSENDKPDYDPAPLAGCGFRQSAIGVLDNDIKQTERKLLALRAFRDEISNSDLSATSEAFLWELLVSARR